MSTEVDSNQGSDQMSTYQWFVTNPLASSCGSAVSSFYCASRDYNRLTQYTIGSVESVVTYTAGTAKPVVNKVVEKLDSPITAVDGIIAGQLVKLEEKFPVIGEQPGEIATKSKDAVFSKLQAGQQTLGKTRAGSIVGYGVDLTLSLTEGIVEKVLPSDESEEEEKEEDEDSKVSQTKDSPVATPTSKSRSWFGLRRRNVKTKEEEEEEEKPPVSKEVKSSVEATVVLSRTDRAYEISQKVYYRSLRRLQTLQKQCSSSLEKLQISINLLHYAQLVTSGVGKQKDNVTQALKDTETKIREFLSCKTRSDPNDGFATWLSEDKSDNDDIKWLLESGKKKDLFQQALDYSKSASQKIYELLKSFSGITGYLPTRLREGAENAMKQAKDVYTTLKDNNVPAELPSFLLSQISEVVETQIMYCRHLGNHISTALKKRFGKDEQSSETSSLGDFEVHVDEEEEEEEINEDEESGSETDEST